MGAAEEMMCVSVLQRGHSGDGCVLTSTLYKYTLRKVCLFVCKFILPGCGVLDHI